MPGAPIVGGAQPPLQTSGAIGMSDINNQFERTFNTEISFRLAETGYYAAVNPWSTYKPNAAAPAALSEWYGYHHTQPMPVHDVTVSATYHSDITDGVKIQVSLSEAAAAYATFGITVTWLDDFSYAPSYDNYYGNISAAGSSVLIDCLPSSFGVHYGSVAVISASPDPNYDQNYVW